MIQNIKTGPFSFSKSNNRIYSVTGYRNVGVITGHHSAYHNFLKNRQAFNYNLN